MLRRWAAGMAIAAVVFGLSAAPYTHAHSAIDSDDSHHPNGEALVHAHPAPHPDDRPDSDGDVQHTWFVASLVCQATVIHSAPAPAPAVFQPVHPRLTSIWLEADRLEPRVHGPPVACSSLLRAPPSVLPASA